MRRNSLRHPTYDYTSPGLYFITICTHKRARLFGDIRNGVMILSALGQIAHDEWLRSATIRAEIEQDEFVIMPDHMHGLVIIKDHQPPPQQPSGKGPKPHSLSALVAGYKATVSRTIHLTQNAPNLRIWQRNFHDRIVRIGPHTDVAAARIRRYIANNPAAWQAENAKRRAAELRAAP